jgi:hypothetical protein
MPSSLMSNMMTTIPPTITSTASTARRVRFKFDDHDRNRYTRSSDDVRSADKPLVHRFEVEIPLRQGMKRSQVKDIVSLLFDE